MTSTSFNPIQLQQTANSVAQPLTLKQGQVFHGTIKQLYPDQMAEIQVGGQRLMAKLEVPLKAGDAHFFQVTNMNPQPELKVVTGPMNQGTSSLQQMQQLLDTMNLPKSTEMQQVLLHFLKEQLPISKELLLATEQWMKVLPEGVTKQEALQAVQRMIELKMPYTKDVFSALVQGQKITGMTAVLDTLTQQLLKDTSLSADVRNSLIQQIQQLAKPFDSEMGGLMLARAVQTLSSQTAQGSDKLTALNLLKEATIYPQQTTIQNMISTSFNRLAQNPVPATMQQAGQVVQTILATQPDNTQQLVAQLKSWITNQPLMTNEQKVQFQDLIQRFSQLPQNKQTIEVFAKQMHEQLIKTFAMNASNSLFLQDENGYATREHLLSLLNPEKVVSNQQEMVFQNIIKAGNESTEPFVQSLLSKTESIVQESLNGKAMEHALKSVLKGLGLSYESALSKHVDDAQIAGQLKPQLLQVVQDTQVAAAVREPAEMLLARLNGMQLLSGENGHQHQLIMQVPLDFFGKKMEATLQWNGRMKDDGKIDSNYARILFYLQMESMQETVIDMQVQNRIVSITVFNDDANLTPVIALVEPLKQVLKNGLEEKGYKLSGVAFKAFEKQTEQKVNKPSEEHVEYQGGVDIRV